MATFKVGEKVIVSDRNSFYREMTVEVLRTCGDQHPDLFVVGITTQTGGSIEWVTHASRLAKSPT